MHQLLYLYIHISLFLGTTTKHWGKCLTEEEKWMSCQEQRFLTSICETLHLYHLIRKRCKWLEEAKNQNSHQIHGEGFGSCHGWCKIINPCSQKHSPKWMEMDEPYIQRVMHRKDQNFIEAKAAWAQLWTKLRPSSCHFLYYSSGSLQPQLSC